MPNPSTVTGFQPFPIQGVSAPGYSASNLRWALRGLGMMEGVFNGAGQVDASAVPIGDMAVTQRAAGAGMAVDVAVGDAYVLNDLTGENAYYHAFILTALTGAAEVTVSTADGTNPRIDVVVLEVKDNAIDGGGLNVMRVRIIAGTPTAGATLDNRNGAAAIPTNCMHLADISVPAADTTISNSQIRDKRPSANGSYYATYAAAEDRTTTGSYGQQTTGNAWRCAFPNVVVPTGGWVDWMFTGTARTTNAVATSIAPFVGANQLKRRNATNPVINDVDLNGVGTATDIAIALASRGMGYVTAAYGGDVTTGMIVDVLSPTAGAGSGPARIIVAAGTYEFSIQSLFNSAQTLTLKNRQMWLQVYGPGKRLG